MRRKLKTRKTRIYKISPDQHAELKSQQQDLEDDVDRRIILLVDHLRRTQISSGPMLNSSRPSAPHKGRSTSPPWWVARTEAIARVEDTISRQYSEDYSRAHLFQLPPPQLFYASTPTHEASVQKAHNWLRIRDWCFAQLLHPDEGRGILMSKFHWLVALEGKYYIISYDHVTVPMRVPKEDIAKLPSAPPDTKRRRLEPSAQPKKIDTAQQNRLAARITVNVRFGVYAGFEPYDATKSFLWGKTSVSSGLLASQSNAEIIREVAWELSVANFRAEFLDLDRLVLEDVYTNPDQSMAARREHVICNIWKNGFVRPMWETDLYCDPLSSPDWSSRVNAIRQMSKAISLWPDGSRFESWDPQCGADANSFNDLEYEIFLFYSSTFHRYYGRRPILPVVQPPTLRKRLLPL